MLDVTFRADVTAVVVSTLSQIIAPSKRFELSFVSVALVEVVNGIIDSLNALLGANGGLTVNLV